MKNHISIFLFFLFILINYPSFAGTTTLTTYYPPPTAAYNKVSLATSATAPSCSTNGTVFVDSTGTLNVCMNGQATTYPQECYNSFCTYDQYGTGINTCNPSNPSNFADGCNGGFKACQQGFGIYGGPDIFQTSNTAWTCSFVCCSGT